MTATTRLAEAGQSLWLDNITRVHLTDGVLRRYITDLSVTGLTSNPSIFNRAIRDGNAYDEAIRREAAAGKSAETVFLSLALEDLTQAADLFRPVYERSGGSDGWVSLEVAPSLADDPAGTIVSAAKLQRRAKRPNLFIKIPGTPAGRWAIEESIVAGVPINVTLLFSAEQYLAAAEAYMRGITRRISAGLDPVVPSVASLFVSRWDVALRGTVPEALRNRVGLAVAWRTYGAYRELLASPRWRRLAKAGARPQRLLWASTGTKDPAAPDTWYIERLAAPDTINTMPDSTLLAYADHGSWQGMIPEDGGDANTILMEAGRVGVHEGALADRLQREGTASFETSWHAMMDCIRTKGGVPARRINSPGEVTLSGGGC